MKGERARQYIRSDKAWYAKAAHIGGPEILINDDEGQGVTVEFAIRWVDNIGPRLECFLESAPAMLGRFADFLDIMRQRAFPSSTPETVESWLRECGIVDGTDYEHKGGQA